MLIAIILRNNRKLKSWSLRIEQLDCCPVTSGDRFQLHKVKLSSRFSNDK